MLDMNEYNTLLKKLNISIIYSGPMWEEGVKRIAEILKDHLAFDNLAGSVAKAIFSTFIEQATNVLMYSQEKWRVPSKMINLDEVPVGLLVLGYTDKVFFIQTINAIKNDNIDFLKKKIDHLNTLNKQELRQYHKEAMRSDNDNPGSKGAGLGLIEIARRVSSPIEYHFKEKDDGLVDFTMYVEIAIKGENDAT